MVRWSLMALLLLAAATADVLGAAHLLRRRRRAVGGAPLAALLLGGAAWCLAYALELGTDGRGVREFWGSAEFAGAEVVPAGWLLFVLQFTGRGQWTGRRLLAALAVEPVAVGAALALPATHDLVRRFAPGPLAPVPHVVVGPLYWPHFAWATALSVGATALLVVRLVRISRGYVRQTVTLAVAAAVPLAANAASSFGLGPARTYDPTPLAVSAGALVLVWGVLRYRLLDLLPPARHLALDRLGDPVLVVDPLGRIVDRNRAAAHLLGPAAGLGVPVHHLVRRHATAVGVTPAGAELTIGTGPDAREYELLTSEVPPRRGATAGRVVHLRDITGRKRAERELRRLAEHDPLTGLPNRRLLIDRLAEAIARAERSQGRCALLLFDVDRFKEINDTLGHQAGDEVLTAIAARLGAGRRHDDTVARLSGDEFAVLLPELTQPDAAALVAARALEAVARPLVAAGRTLQVTVSVGVAVWPDDGPGAADLLRRADAAMYRTKRAGRDRTPLPRHPATDGRDGGGPAVPTPPAERRLARRTDRAADLADDLAGATRRGELQVRFQPFVDLRDGRVTAVEALHVWAHPRFGDLTAPAFLPAVRALGLAHELDRRLLAHACSEGGRWFRGGRGVPVWVRLAAHAGPEARPDGPRGERRGAAGGAAPGGTRGAGGGTGGAVRTAAVPGPAADVARALDRATLPPDLLVLQVGEADLAAGGNLLAAELDAVRRLGVRLALADGAAGAAFGRARALPLDVVAVRAGAGPQDAAGTPALGAMVTFAQVLGLAVVATGVDRPDQLAPLRERGCAAVQGDHLCPPLDADAADRLLDTGSIELPAAQVEPDAPRGGRFVVTSPVPVPSYDG